MKQSSLPLYPFVFTTSLTLKWLSHIFLPPHTYQFNSMPFFLFIFLSSFSTIFPLCLLSGSNSFSILHPFLSEQPSEILIVITHFKIMTQIKESIGGWGEMLWVTHSASKQSLVDHGWFLFIFHTEPCSKTRLNIFLSKFYLFKNKARCDVRKLMKTNSSTNYWLKQNFT